MASAAELLAASAALLAALLSVADGFMSVPVEAPAGCEEERTGLSLAMFELKNQFFFISRAAVPREGNLASFTI